MAKEEFNVDWIKKKRVGDKRSVDGSLIFSIFAI